jgi:RNA polymerase sigma-70 factor (ECF subfamily)
MGFGPQSEDLYRKLARPLWALLYARTCDPDLAMDAVHEAFARYAEHADPNSIKEPQAWLLQVGRNWLTDEWRRNSRATPSSEALDGFGGDFPDPARAYELVELQENVRAGLARMREEEREVLVLRYALQWPSDRIAETLDTSATAIDMRLSRARRRLAEILTTAGVVDERRS